jgi:hypothetical protein
MIYYNSPGKFKYKFQTGGTIRELYEKTTGKSWATAKEEGLTDGSAEGNLQLSKKLQTQLPASAVTNSLAVQPGAIAQPVSTAGKAIVQTPGTFVDAFKQARATLGPNKIFEFQGRRYGTNMQGEKFEPSAQDMMTHKLPLIETQKRLKDQNAQVSSLYTSKKTVKLEPSYKDWDDIKKRNTEINAHDNASKIVQFQSTKPNEQYLVVDKKLGRMHLYIGANEITSYKIGTGVNAGDDQTRTWVDKGTGKTDWSKGNFSTGAGTYTITGSTSKNKHYSDAPSFNMKNEYGIEVPMAIHAALPSRVRAIADNNPSNNRVSSGCINGLCHNLRDLYKHNIQPGTKVYILPDDDRNSYQYENGLLNFKSKQSTVNRTVNTLKANPIKVLLDETRFKKEVYNWTDMNDDKEYEKTTKPFIRSLEKNKALIMGAAKINGDVYNDIAKMTFGIYGTESNYGDTHGAEGNLLRAVAKAFNPKGSSSPDYMSKATTYGATGENQSVGLTQIRFSYLNSSEKIALAKVGINKNTDFLDPTKAAVGTAIVLGVRYNEQLNDNQKKDMFRYLPTKWNKRSNYADRVMKNSSYIKLQEYR